MKTIKKSTTAKRIMLFLNKVEACKNMEDLDPQEQWNRINEAKEMLNYLPGWAADEYKRQLKHMAVTEKNRIEKEMLKKYGTVLPLQIEAKYVVDLDKMAYLQAQVNDIFKNLVEKLSEVIDIQYSKKAEIEAKIGFELLQVIVTIFKSDIPQYFAYTKEKLFEYFDLLEKKDKKEKALTLF